MNALDWMNLHVEALFLHDEQGRMQAVNENDRSVAPRVFLGRTVNGNIWRCRHDLSPGLIAELEAILAAEPVVADLEQPATTRERLSEALAQYGAVKRIWEGPAWHFPKQIDVPSEPQAVMVTPGMEFSGERFSWLVDELQDVQPVFAVLDGSRIVSLCHSSRNTPAAPEAGVETLEGYRGRGYATAVVAAWAREVRRQGRQPLYSTSWDNHASRALAGRLGLALYGADLHLT